MNLISLRGLLISLLMAAAVGVGAQEVPPLAAVSPLWLGHLRPEGLELQDVQEEGWTLRASFAYGNSFFVSPEIIQIHNEIDGVGADLNPAVLQQARELWQQSDLYSIDTEISRFDVEAGYSFGKWFGGLRVPVWRIGGTTLDGWPSATHDFLSVSNSGREFFPEGRTIVALMPPDGGSWMFTGQQSARVTGISGWGGRRWSIGDTGGHRLWFTASAPIDGGEPLADTGWNGGLRWSISNQWQGLSLYAGLGWTHQGGQAGTLGDAADTLHLWAGTDISLGKRWRFLALFRIDDSVFADVDPGKAGRATGEFALGFSAPLASSLRLHLVLGEDFPGMGMAPDFSIQGSLVWRP